MSADVSNLYCHAVRDRLYCDSLDSPERQQCVQVLTHTLETVLRAMGPIVPHLAEEICMHWPGKMQILLRIFIVRSTNVEIIIWFGINYCSYDTFIPELKLCP